jgi:cell division protease FtsH
MGQYLESTMSFGEQCNFSEKTAEKIDDEVHNLIEGTYQRVKAILARRRRPLERITSELQKRETIGREELDKLVAEADALTPAVA